MLLSLTEASSILLGDYWEGRNLWTFKIQYPGLEISMFYSSKRIFQCLLRRCTYMLFKCRENVIFIHYNRERNIEVMTQYADFHHFHGRLWNSFNKNFITRKNIQERRRIKKHPTIWMLTQIREQRLRNTL